MIDETVNMTICIITMMAFIFVVLTRLMLTDYDKIKLATSYHLSSTTHHLHHLIEYSTTEKVLCNGLNVLNYYENGVKRTMTIDHNMSF